MLSRLAFFCVISVLILRILRRKVNLFLECFFLLQVYGLLACLIFLRILRGMGGPGFQASSNNVIFLGGPTIVKYDGIYPVHVEGVFFYRKNTYVFWKNDCDKMIVVFFMFHRFFSMKNYPSNRWRVIFVVFYDGFCHNWISLIFFWKYMYFFDKKYPFKMLRVIFIEKNRWNIRKRQSSMI